MVLFAGCTSTDITQPEKVINSGSPVIKDVPIVIPIVVPDVTQPDIPSPEISPDVPTSLPTLQT